MKKLSLFICLLIIIILSGCGNQINIKRLQLSFRNMPVLESGYYELWIMGNNDKQMVKKFIVDQEGNMLNPGGSKIENNTLVFNKSMSDYKQIKVIAVSKETWARYDDYPVILEKEIIPPYDIMPLKFTQLNLDEVSAKYHLGTVSDIKNPKTSFGIWFAEINKDGVESPGLKLPPTPSGWIYEGWIKRDDQLLSLGRFGSPFERDLDNPYILSLSSVKYAGEDFLQNQPKGYEFPLDLADGKTEVFITLQPYINGEQYNFKKPFITLFKAKVPRNLEPWIVKDMTFTSDELPTAQMIWK